MFNGRESHTGLKPKKVEHILTEYIFGGVTYPFNPYKCYFGNSLNVVLCKEQFLSTETNIIVIRY